MLYGTDLANDIAAMQAIGSVAQRKRMATMKGFGLSFD
jgi:hypothetical protein